MKTNKKNFLKFALMCTVLTFGACSDKNDTPTVEPEETKISKYIVTAGSGENNYLVAGDNISASTTFDATSSGAFQSPGDRIWSFVGDNVAYGFLYNQADAGVTSSYILDANGKIQKRNELALNVSIQTKGLVNGKLILAYSDRLRDVAAVQKAYFYSVDPANDASKSYTVTTSDLLEKGETAYLTDIAEFDGKMIAAARSISDSGFKSKYYNNTYIIVFNNDFTVNKVIKDSGRTGFVAGQLYSQGETGLEVIDNGDLYAFSSAQTNYADAASSTIPSGILKINKGTTTFDGNYFFNITEASNGYNLFRAYYVGGTKFVLSMYPGKGDKATFGVAADRFAVVDVSSKTFKWVTGIPKAATTAAEDKFSVGAPFVDGETKNVLVPIRLSDNTKFVYSIDANTAVATQGAKIISEDIKAIGKLSYKESK